MKETLFCLVYAITRRMALVAVLVVWIAVLANGQAAAQSNGQATTQKPSATTSKAPVTGSGTPGIVPVWTGTATIGDSHVQDDGSTVSVGLPMNVKGVVNVSGPINAIDRNGGIAVLAGNGGVGVRGQGTTMGVQGQGDIGVQGQGDTGIKGDGMRFGVHGSGAAGVYGQGIGASSIGVAGEGTRSGVVGDGPVFGVFGQSTGGGVGVKAIQGIQSGNDADSGAGVDSFSANNIGVRAWGPNVGVRGVSDKIGILGQIRDPGTPVDLFNVPIPTVKVPDTSVGVVGNCMRPSTLGCIGIYGYGNAGSGFAHGIVGETDFVGPDGAGVIGLSHHGGQGVRGGSDDPNGIGVNGYNSAGGKAGQFQGDVYIYGDLHVFGNAYKSGGGSWSTASDFRLKKSVQPINGALRQLLQLRGVSYEYTNPSAIGELPGAHIGMVAQEVEQVFPSWVDTGKDGYKRLTFRGFEAVTVEAVRELDAKVSANSKEAMARITDLERQNTELRHALEVLSETVKAIQHK